MTQSRSGLVVATVFLGLVCVAFIVFAWFAHAIGDVFMAGLMGVFGVYLAVALPYGLVTRWPARRPNPELFRTGHARTGEPCLIAPTPPAKVAVALAATIVSALAAVALVLLAGLGGPVPLLLGVLVGSLPVAVLVRTWRRRLHRGHVAVAPSGLELQTWTEGVAVPWDEIAEIRVSNRKRNPTFVMLLLDERADADSAVRTWHPASRMWRTALPAWDPAHRVATITVEHVGLHLDMLLALLWRYWNDSHRRGELATPTALHRLQRHQFDQPVPAASATDGITSHDPAPYGVDQQSPSPAGAAESSRETTAGHACPAGQSSPRGPIVAGLVGLVFVAASVILPFAVQIGMLAGEGEAFGIRAATVVFIGVGLYGCVLMLLHALLRAARVPRPRATLLIGGAITVVVGVGYLALLSLVFPGGGELSPLWPVFAAGCVVFAACARERTGRKPHA